MCSPGTACGTGSPRPCQRSRSAAFGSPSRAPTWPESRGAVTSRQHRPAAAHPRPLPAALPLLPGTPSCSPPRVSGAGQRPPPCRHSLPCRAICSPHPRDPEPGEAGAGRCWRRQLGRGAGMQPGIYQCVLLWLRAAPLGNIQQRNGHGTQLQQLTRAGSAAGKPTPQIPLLILSRLPQHTEGLETYAGLE